MNTCITCNSIQHAQCSDPSGKEQANISSQALKDMRRISEKKNLLMFIKKQGKISVKKHKNEERGKVIKELKPPIFKAPDFKYPKRPATCILLM